MNDSLHPPLAGGLQARFAAAAAHYRDGAWRDRVLHDLILGDAHELGNDLTFLDIGCGKGFDSDVPLQRSLAEVAGRYIGVEPDPEIEQGDHFALVHRTIFEEAPVPPGSVDVAFAIMVLEHLRDPKPFFDKLHEVLAPGGVFWGLTVDRRHWFPSVSLLAERLKVKQVYLDLIMGERGSERYENYPVHYRCNSPEQIRPYVQGFQRCDFLNLARPDDEEGIFPRPLRPLWRLVRNLLPEREYGTLLAVRIQK